MRSTQTSLRRFYPLLALAFFVVSLTGCADFQFTWQEQPLLITPEKAQTQVLSEADLAPLGPVVLERLLGNIKAWRLEIKLWRGTAELYNSDVKKRNEETRRLLKEP